MSGVLRVVGKVAGVVATVAMLTGNPVVAGIASAVAVAANVGAEVTAKKPPARGSVNATTIGSDQPMPFLVGETYYGGSRRWATGYGPTRDKVPNPYALIVDVYSGAGPVEGLVDCLADFTSLGVPEAGGGATGYAGGFLWADVHLGQMPEPRALAPHWAGAPGWGADYRLSGHAAIAWSLLFDRKGKVFASGVPQLGAVWRGQRCWDPRADATWPGGAGGQRWAAPADTAAHDAARGTWGYTASPALVALKYALGAWHRDPRVAGSTYAKVAGIGQPLSGIIVEDFVHLANVCDANGWTCGGVVMEPAIGSPSTRWQNLKDILAAGGAEPCWRAGRLGLKLSAPRIALDTIREADLADDEVTVASGLGWEGRLNTLVPKYRSRDHRWEYVASTTPVSIAAQVEQDGEVKREERQYNLVQDGDQAAQLCAYELLDRRELGEIELTVKPRLRRYGPGDLLTVDLPEHGLASTPCVILKRQPLPDRMAWKLTLVSETLGKHAFALGRTSVPPPAPALRSTEAMDGVAAPIAADRGAHQIATAKVGGAFESTVVTIKLPAQTDVVLDDGASIALPEATLEGLTAGTTYVVTWSLSAGSYAADAAPAPERYQDADRVIVRLVTTQQADGTYPPQPTPGGGDGGGGYGGGGIRGEVSSQ